MCSAHQQPLDDPPRADPARSWASSDYVVVNDFGAVAHAVARARRQQLRPPLRARRAAAGRRARSASSAPAPGSASRTAAATTGGYRVQATEGGHIDFAPLDAIEDAILAALRKQLRRVSVERIVVRPRAHRTSTTRSPHRGPAGAPSTTTRRSGRAAMEGRTAWPPPRSTASACRSARRRRLRAGAGRGGAW